MIILFDIGNTNTHLGLANSARIIRQTNIPTSAWMNGSGKRLISRFGRRASIHGAALCSVVPRATPTAIKTIKQLWNLPCLELTPGTLRGVSIQYPKPETIGPDRLANAVAARHHFGAPVVVVDFGTAVTFDVVNRAGRYIGGIIAPGLAAMTEYLHEKTALLPKIRIREIKRLVGKSTEEAMLIGAVHGYRGLIHALLNDLKRDLGSRRLPVIATGGYARLMAAKLPDITSVDLLITLEGLRLVWQAHCEESHRFPAP